MTDTMAIWDAVSKTDPSHTKEVSFGRKFTAIDAHSQIMEATRQFGPIGIGWGYESGAPIFEQSAVIVPVTVWHTSRENTFGPVYGGSEMFGKKLDTDAPKKATTDGLTKALSLLGFNADVFLGKFDDNKYVQSLRQDKERANTAAKGLNDAWRDAVLDSLPENPTDKQKAEGFSEAIIRDMKERKGVASLGNVWSRHEKIINAMSEKFPTFYANIVETYETCSNSIKESA